LIHNSLTQDQVRELTGFSKGSVSTNLNALEEYGFLKKKLIKGTRKYLYSRVEDFSQLSVDTGAFKKEINEKAKKFFRSKIKELNEFKDKKGYKILSERLSDIMKFLEIHKKLIDHIMNSRYFLTRKHLTQEMIKNLTGLSRGTISQELNRLVKEGIIHKSDVSSTGEITYTLDSVEFAFVHAFYNAQKDIVEFGKKLTDLKEEIQENKENLENLNGFKEINQIVKLLTFSVPFSLELYEMLEKEFYDLKD